jgi:hypothetical protein
LLVVDSPYGLNIDDWDTPEKAWKKEDFIAAIGTFEAVRAESASKYWAVCFFVSSQQIGAATEAIKEKKGKDVLFTFANDKEPFAAGARFDTSIVMHCMFGFFGKMKPGASGEEDIPIMCDEHVHGYSDRNKVLSDGRYQPNIDNDKHLKLATFRVFPPDAKYKVPKTDDASSSVKMVQANKCQKSVDMLRWIVRHFSAPGAAVVCMCSGSGSDQLAAIQEGRSYLSFENNAQQFLWGNTRVSDFIRANSPSKPFVSWGTAEVLAQYTVNLLNTHIQSNDVALSALKAQLTILRNHIEEKSKSNLLPKLEVDLYKTVFTMCIAGECLARDLGLEATDDTQIEAVLVSCRGSLNTLANEMTSADPEKGKLMFSDLTENLQTLQDDMHNNSYTIGTYNFYLDNNKAAVKAVMQDSVCIKLLGSVLLQIAESAKTNITAKKRPNPNEGLSDAKRQKTPATRPQGDGGGPSSAVGSTDQPARKKQRTRGKKTPSGQLGVDAGFVSPPGTSNKDEQV